MQFMSGLKSCQLLEQRRNHWGRFGGGGVWAPAFEATPQLLAYLFIFFKEIALLTLKTPLYNVNLILPQNILKLTYINIRSMGRDEEGGGKGMRDGWQHVGPHL